MSAFELVGSHGRRLRPRIVAPRLPEFSAEPNRQIEGSGVVVVEAGRAVEGKCVCDPEIKPGRTLRDPEALDGAVQGAAVAHEET